MSGKTTCVISGCNEEAAFYGSWLCDLHDDEWDDSPEQRRITYGVTQSIADTAFADWARRISLESLRDSEKAGGVK